MGYTKRKSFGRFQFILDAGFDSTYFGIELSATYLDPWEVEDMDMQMNGFWCIRVALLFVEFTVNITDKTFRRDKMRYPVNPEV